MENKKKGVCSNILELLNAYQVSTMHLKYFHVKHKKSLELGYYGVWRANVPNTPETLEKALELYPRGKFFIEFDNSKINVNVFCS